MQSLTVRHVRWYSPDIFELALERDGLDFTPGDCLALYHDEESRPYSIASGDSEELLRFVIRRLPGGAVSGFLALRQSGQQVRVSAPFGWFRPGRGGPPGSPSVYIATGTGMAPFLSALRSYQTEAPAAFLLGVRQLADAVSLPYLQARGGVRVALSRQWAAPHFHGHVTQLLHQLPLDSDAHFYLCGLDAMIDEASEWLESHGVDATQIHREVFFHA